MEKLVFEHVSKRYGSGDTAVTALNQVSLKVQSGEFIAIVGPSGSGKTTMLAIAGTLLRASEGLIKVNGQDLSQLSEGQLARFRLEQIGFVLQASNLVPSLTVQDQLLLVAELRGKRNAQTGKRAQELLETVGLGHRLRHYPEQLSGGERQRVAIARALMNNPELLLVDEPTASLDSHRGTEVVRMIANQVHEGGKAAVMVTHDERMLRFCDRILRIVDGNLFLEEASLSHV